MTKYSYSHPRPCVTVDSLVFRREAGRWQILLVERGNEPFKGCWALPGGFVEMDESLSEAAARELREETGLDGVALHQLHAFGDPGRDPRHRTITVAYWGIDESGHEVRGNDDAADARWFDIAQLPPLAFDHDKIIGMATATIGQIKETNI